MKGFTLIELMVTVAMATVIMAVVLFNNAQFNSSIVLTNATYEVALAVRQAQVFGLSTRAVNLGGGKIDQAYGIYVSVLNNDTSKYVHLFADAQSLGDSGYHLFEPNEEITGGVVLGRGLYVKDLCYKVGGTKNCYSEDMAGNPSYVSTTVLFKRPEPEAEIREAVGGGSPDDSTGPTLGNVDFVSIVLGSHSDGTAERCVVVYKSGQISVKSKGNDPCN